MVLKRLEQEKFSIQKKRTIINSLRKKDHESLAFFICRNPVERLQSVYHYLTDLRVGALLFISTSSNN